MKRKFILIALLTTFSFNAHAQWSGTNPLTTTGNVGIGTSAAPNKLSIYSTASADGLAIDGTTNPAITLKSSGTVIGYSPAIVTSSGGYFTDSQPGDFVFRSEYNNILFGRGGGNSTFAVVGNKVGVGTSNPDSQFQIHVSSDQNFKVIPPYELPGGFRIFSTNDANNALEPMEFGGNQFYFNGGNVGIGTADPQGYKLAVNGDMIATSIKVKLYADWPDYVFKPAYRLPNLSSVKNYIDKNRHLPDMPSEQEVAKDGLNLGEMNKLLVKKVEELTLYLIEQNKKTELLEQQVAKLTKEIHQY